MPPLAFPDPRVLPPLEVLTQYEAVRLFVERARAVKADFAVTNENAPAVAEICARLDGLPLAIELAAARVRMLPPQKMLKRLRNRLKLLKGGTRSARPPADPEGHHRLELRAPRGGREDAFRKALRVRGGAYLGGHRGDLRPRRGPGRPGGGRVSLEKSLLRQEEGVGGEPRFVMLETVHEYAREKLQESGEAEELKSGTPSTSALAEETEPSSGHRTGSGSSASRPSTTT